MTVWIIEPRDPLIVRDGRPFGPMPGARARSLAFPFPSTTTGGVRTRDGSDPYGRFQVSEIERVKSIAVRGPLLAELDPKTGDIDHWLVPAPSDALLLDVEPPDPTRADLRRLVPLAPPSGNVSDITNLPDGLELVGMPKPDSRKPCGNSPHYWRWGKFNEWLLQPQEGELALKELGHSGPVPEVRMHASIDSMTGKALDRALFQTRGLEFTGQSGRSRLAMAVATDAPYLKPGLASLGGERRLVSWRRSKCSLPSCPQELRDTIISNGHCRVVLLTPAHFLGGWRPSWLVSPREGVNSTLQAVAVRRSQVVSGWDFAEKKPKPTRRLAPAGTVLFLKLEGDKAALEKWVETTWMSCISDEEQDRRDGFGLAVLGTWDGTLQRMEV